MTYIAKDGYAIIAGAIIFAFIVTLGAILTGSLLTKIFTVLSWVFVVFSMFFFRDPERTIPPGEDLILSAADGTVVEIKEIRDDTFINGEAKQVSIFLSVFNVHINRVPISGKVGYFKYIPGKFIQAYKEKASEDNEQTVIGIQNKKTKIVIKQIAGILARRIVCNIREGNSVNRGERFGMIKFGSRVDMIFPPDVEVLVHMGQKVKGGESIIAKIHSD
jgi:phosphatidylserine decarboxylase